MEGNESNLPSFFQFKGTTVADGLLEELGGELEDDEVELESNNFEAVDLDLIPEDVDIDEIVTQVREQIKITSSQYGKTELQNGYNGNEKSILNNRPEPVRENVEISNTFYKSIQSQGSELSTTSSSITLDNNKKESNASDKLLKILKKPNLTSQPSLQQQPLPSHLIPQVILPLQQFQSPAGISKPFVTNSDNRNFPLPNFPPQRFPPPRNHFTHYNQQLYKHPPADNSIRSSSMMSYNDIDFVVKKVLDPMKSADPFSDDYYFIQFNIKKNKQMHDEAIANKSADLPPLLFIPLPTWKDSKERIRKQIELTKQGYDERSRKWEEKQQVLGHIVKADISRPKETLSVTSINDLYSNQMLDENEVLTSDTSMKLPFSSRLWNMRLAVQRGYEALYTVQELQYLLHTPVLSDNSINKNEVLEDIQTALVVLAQSLGIKNGNSNEPSNITLEGGLVAAILQTSKGKRLLSRSIELLPPNQRWVLIPAIIARVLQVNPTDLSDEDKLVEDKLLKTLTDFIRHAHNYQQELKLNAPINESMGFSQNILNNLRQCLKSVMVTFLDKNELRQTLLSSRHRAQVMHIITQIGDKISLDVDNNIRDDWISIKETFMSMLDTN